jgi:hypothetical protein
MRRDSDQPMPKWEQSGGQNDPRTEELVAQVFAQRRAFLPLEGREARMQWRNQELVARRQRGSQERSWQAAPLD